MEKYQNAQESYSKKLLVMYFSKLMLVNEHQEQSTVFVISTQILKLLFSHILVFCVFLLKNIKEDQQSYFIWCLKEIFKNKSWQNYEIFKLINFSTLGFQLIFIALLFVNQKNQKKFQVRKIVYFMNIFMRFTSQLFFCIIGIVFYISLKQAQYHIVGATLFDIIAWVFLFKITPIFLQKCSFQTKDVFCHNHNSSAQIVSICYCILTFFTPVLVFIEVSQIIQVILSLIWISLQIWKIKNTLVTPYYQNETTQSIYCLNVCFETTVLFIYVMLNFVQINSVQKNSLMLITIVTMLSFWGLTNYNKYIMLQVFFIDIQQPKQQHQLFSLMNQYYKAIQSLKKDDNLSELSLIVSSIKKNHQNNCKNINCYCYSQTSLKNFLRNYVFDLTQQLEKNYSQNTAIKIYISSFKFHVFHHYPKIFQQLSSIQNIKSLSLYQFMKIMRLKSQIKSQIDKKNNLYNVINLQIAIKLQEDISILNDIILDDIQVKYKKWTTFSKELSRIEEVRKMSHKELENLIKVSQIKVEKWSQYSRSPVFNLMLYFYFKRVVLKTSDLGDIEENIRNLGRKIKEEEITRPTFFEKYLFHKNACTIQSSLHESSLGMIISTSRSIERVFGYSHKRIIGENLSCLFPPFLAKEQHATMKEWFDKGGDIQTVSKVTETYCHHKQNYSFVAQRYNKIYMVNGDIFLITTFFKKKQNDLILINDKFELETFGKSLKLVLKHIGHKIQCDYVFKGMKKKLLNADFNEQKTQKTIIFNQTYTTKLLNGEKKTHDQSNVNSQGNQKQSNQEVFNDSTKELQDIWKLTFTYVKVQIGERTFYKIQAKGIEEIKKLSDFVSKKEEVKQIQSDLNYCNDSDSGNGISKEMKVIQIGQQQNSSMASFSSQLGYGISKLISHFSFILLNPKKLSDQRIKQKIFIDIAFYILLVSILTATIAINKFSLQEKTISLKAKSRIDSVFHLLQISSNHAYNLYMYKNNDEVKNTIMEEIKWDSDKFVSELKSQFAQMQDAITNLQGEVLYDYLKIPVNWTFTNSSSQQCQLLEIFKLCHYVFLEIKTALSQNSTYDVPSYNLLTVNIAQLRKIRQNLITITQKTLLKNDSFSINYLIITLILLFVFSAFFGIYSHLYRKFRFDQSQNHIKVYLMIPHQILKNLTEYYSSYYKHYVLGKIRIDSALQSESQMFEPELEELTQNQQLNSNKIKLMGKGSYLAWIGIAVIFILLNGGNAVISYNMFNFNRQVDFFYRLTNSISISESMLVNRLIRMKSQYYFNRGMLNQSFISLMLSTINQTQVAFNSYVTFDSNTITDSDPTFRIEFNKILTTNPCVLHQDMLDQNQLKICNQEAVLSKNGIITFVNGFARLMQNTYLSWQKNLNPIINSTDIFANSTQFREYDLMVTFHIPTFRKLSEKIIGVYQNGFNYQYQTYFIIYLGLVIFLVLLFVENIYKTFQDKLHLSFLYGYILLFPPSVLKQSKYLLKFIQTNLEFSEKH